MREPFGQWTIQAIARLTDYQLYHIVLRPRDEDGQLIRRKKQSSLGIGEEVTFEAMFREVWRQRGKSEEDIETIWQEYLADNPGLRYA